MLTLRTLTLLVLSTTTLLPAASAGTCFWANGTAADTKHLQPCKTSLGNDGVFACCPPQGADDLYPLDYPVCTPAGLCQAGNSDFTARGGCTDASFASPSCPRYCPYKRSDPASTGAMAGITNCDGRNSWFCCDADHDAGACDCDPPSGLAFMIKGTSPLFFSDAGADGSGSGSGSGSSPASPPSSPPSSPSSPPSSPSSAPSSPSAPATSNDSKGGSSSAAAAASPATSPAAGAEESPGGAVTLTASAIYVTAGSSSSPAAASKPISTVSNPAALHTAAAGSLGLAAVAAGFLLL